MLWDSWFKSKRLRPRPARQGNSTWQIFQTPRGYSSPDAKAVPHIECGWQRLVLARLCALTGHSLEEHSSSLIPTVATPAFDMLSRYPPAHARRAGVAWQSTRMLVSPPMPKEDPSGQFRVVSCRSHPDINWLWAVSEPMHLTTLATRAGGRRDRSVRAVTLLFCWCGETTECPGF